MLSIDQTATRLRKRIPVQPVAVFMYWWNCSIFYDLTVWLSGLRRLTFTREALGSNLPGFTFENISSTMPISTPDALTHAQMRPTRLRKRITRLRKRRSGGWDTLRSVTSITQPYLWAWDDERVLCNWLQTWKASLEEGGKRLWSFPLCLELSFELAFGTKSSDSYRNAVLSETYGSPYKRPTYR